MEQEVNLMDMLKMIKISSRRLYLDQLSMLNIKIKYLILLNENCNILFNNINSRSM